MITKTTLEDELGKIDVYDIDTNDKSIQNFAFKKMKKLTLRKIKDLEIVVVNYDKETKIYAQAKTFHNARFLVFTYMKLNKLNQFKSLNMNDHYFSNYSKLGLFNKQYAAIKKLLDKSVKTKNESRIFSNLDRVYRSIISGVWYSGEVHYFEFNGKDSYSKAIDFLKKSKAMTEELSFNFDNSIKKILAAWSG